MMKSLITSLLTVFLGLTMTLGQDTQPQQNNTPSTAKHMEKDIIYIVVGNTKWKASLEKNSSAQALKKRLTQGDLTIQMEDYAQMEKVGPIGANLPTNDQHITTQTGDLILYQGKYLVIYYASNTWNFTRLGKILHVTKEDLLKILGKGNVKVTLSLD